MLSMIAPMASWVGRSHASRQTCHTPRARRDDVLQLEPASPRYCAPIDLTADVSAGQRPGRVCKLPGRAFACLRCGCVFDGRVTAVPVMTWDSFLDRYPRSHPVVAWLHARHRTAGARRAHSAPLKRIATPFE